jgi:hypothetical protein
MEEWALSGRPNLLRLFEARHLEDLIALFDSLS